MDIRLPFVFPGEEMELLITKIIGIAGMAFFGIVAIVATKKYEKAKEELDKLKGEQK